MFGNSHAVTLLRNFIELRFPNSEVFCKLYGIHVFCKMSLDIFINLYRKLLSMQRYHSFHAEVGSDRLHDMGGGRDMVFCDDRLAHNGHFQSLHINVVIAAALPDLCPPLFVGRIGKDMTEEQISDYDISDDDRGDAFCQSRMALVGVQGSAPGGCFTGALIAEAALLCGIWVSTDNLAEVRNLFRTSGKFMEHIVKDSNADLRQIIKIP